MNGPSKDTIRRVIQSKGWFWVDHNKGMRKKMREIVREGDAVEKFANKHGIYYTRPSKQEALND